MADLRQAMAVAVGNPSTAENSDNHVEIQQTTAPQVPIVASSKTLVIALAAFFVIIFALHKAEKWARKGVA